MATLIETLGAFIGTMLVFALVAQSLQELLKTMFVIKGQTLRNAINGLVREATKANRQWTIDAEAILRQVMARIGGLGQDGVLPGKIRLDAIPAAQLESLISKVEPADVPGLPGDRDQALAILAAIGQQAKEWYPIAVAPVDDRYRRRMRVLALFSSALVVLPFNLDAIRIFSLAQTSPEFRAQAMALATRLDSVYQSTTDTAQVALARTDSAATVADSNADSLTAPLPTASPPTATSSARARPVYRPTESDMQEIRQVYSAELLGRFSLDNLSRPRWWFGTLLSILLVSLGAPFWHDLLEALFGLKNRLGKGSGVRSTL